MLILLQKISRALTALRLDRIRGCRRFLLFCFRALHPSGHADVKVAEGAIRIDLGDRGQAPYLFLFGAYDETEKKVLESIVRPGMHTADVGAHHGYFTLILSRLVGPEGRVYAFEPESAVYALLEETIRINGLTNVTPVRAALGDKTGMMNLFLDSANFGNASFASDNIPAQDRTGECEVSVITLDEYLQGRKLDVVKIDVQGGEGRALRGARETILRWKPAIFTEFWPYGLRNLGTDPKEFVASLMAAGLCCALVDARSGSLKDVSPETAQGIARNRPGGKGWANMLCRKT